MYITHEYTYIYIPVYKKINQHVYIRSCVCIHICLSMIYTHRAPCCIMARRLQVNLCVCVCVVCMSHTHNHLDVLAGDSARYIFLKSTYFMTLTHFYEIHSRRWNLPTLDEIFSLFVEMKSTHFRRNLWPLNEISLTAHEIQSFPDECQALQMKFTHGGWNPLT